MLRASSLFVVGVCPTLLIGKGDWDEITATPPMQGANVTGFKSWIDEKRKVEPLAGGKDVCGDGSVIVLRMPGHTPGSSCLLVRLKEMGPVLPSGDLVPAFPAAAK
jgi:glyoxylase-like metal-dependent hydrolase (beta-lactamase superfamily II)